MSFPVIITMSVANLNASVLKDKMGNVVFQFAE